MTLRDGPIARRLAALGIVLPEAPAPAANYVAVVRMGNLLSVSGQGPVDGREKLSTGRVGQDLSLEQGKYAARLTCLNVLAQVAAALDGDLDRVKRVVKLFGLVNSAPDFVQQAQVMNGASDLMVEIFGDRGRHARAAIGSPALPFNISVEIDGIFEVA